MATYHESIGTHEAHERTKTPGYISSDPSCELRSFASKIKVSVCIIMMEREFSVMMLAKGMRHTEQQN